MKSNPQSPISNREIAGETKAQKIIQITELNAQLQNENESLKSQLNRALGLTTELELLHKEKRSLNTKIFEYDQKITNYQNRLQILSEKNQELQIQIDNFDLVKEGIQHEKEMLVLELEKVKSENTQLHQANEEYKQSFSLAKQSESAFFRNISNLSDQDISNYIEITELFRQMKSEIDNNVNGKNNQKIIQSLQKKNAKFKKSIESLKQQNEELMHQNKANESFNTTQSLTKELNDMKRAQAQLIQDYDEEILKYKEQIEIKEQRINNLREQIARPVIAQTEEMQKLIQQLNFLSNENKNLSNTIKEIQSHNDDLKNKLSKANIKITQYKKYKKQIGNVNKMFTEKQKENQIQIQQLQLKNEELARNLNDSKLEIESLQIQIQAAHASFKQSEVAWCSKNNELQEARNSFSLIESQTKSQMKEIDSLNNIKSSAILIIQKMNSILLEQEKRLESEHIKNQKLKKRNKLLKSRMDNYIPNTLFDFLQNLFTKELDKKNCDKLLLIINESSKSHVEKIQKLFSKLLEIVKNPNINNGNNETENNKNLNEVLLSLNYGFSNLIKCIGDDQSLFDFLSLQTRKIENSLKNEEIINQIDLKDKNLFSCSYEQRKEAIQNISKQGFSNDTTFNLFCLQSFINIILYQQNEKQRNFIDEYKNQISQIKKIFGTVESQKLSKKIKKLEIIDKNYGEMKRNKEFVQNLKKKNKEKEENIKNLRQNLGSVVTEISILQNELETKTQQLQSLQKSHSQLTEETKELQKKSFDEVSQCENIIEEKNKEIRELTIQMQITKSDFEHQISRLKKDNESMKNLYKTKEIKFKQIIAMIRQKQKKQENKFKELLQITENQLNEVTQKANDSELLLKTHYENTINKMKSQIEENHLLNENLSNSLQTNEDKIQQLSQTLSKTIMEKNSAEAQIQTLNEQMIRESQILKQQFTCKSISDETLHQKEILALISENNKNKHNIFTTILNEFDELDQLDGIEIEDGIFMKVMKNIAKKYLKLQGK